jgi:Ca-activated chloride channel family protein
MQFFSPWNLLWLLWLVPVIVFFYLLKLKRREMVVSSVLLWNHLVKDVQANAPFQKLKKNLLLLLQLLIALFAVLALARPALVMNALGGKEVVVVLDGSASMQSTDGRGTRFDEAKALALKMVANMRGGDRMMVLLATSRTHRLTGVTTDKNELRRAINSARAMDTTTDLRDALLLAVSVVGSSTEHKGARIYVISDGAFPEMQDLDTREAEVEFVKVGTRANNVGLVAMDVRRSFKEQGGYQMFVAARNYSPEAKKCNIEFYRNDALIDVRPLELKPAEKAYGYSEKAEIFSDVPETSGILHARLDIKDDLAADNEAYSQLSPRQDINVLLVTESNLYLEKALNVDPHVHLSVVTPSAYNGQGGFDVVVFENEPPDKVGPGNHLYINCGGDTAPVEIEKKITNATILDWDRTHPVMRFVKLAQLQLAEALQASKKPWGVVLAEHESGPVIVIGERRGVKSAYVGFPLLRSEFPLRVSFPIFFNNLVQWLAARPGKTEGVQLRAGGAATLEVPPTLTELTVTDPDGKKYRVRPEGRVAYFAETERAGIYKAEGKNFRQEFAVNLLSRDESATLPQNRIKIGNRPLLAGTGTVKTSQEQWRWLFLLAILVLAVEWWVYHRRI